jgi:hypothetical protein
VKLVTDVGGSDLAMTAAVLGVTATDNCELDRIECVPQSAGVGTTTVRCTALDKSGNSDFLDVEVTVLTPGQAATALAQAVVGAGLESGVESSLISKLENAALSYERGRGTPGSNKLNAFLNEVQAQRGKKIDEATADALIAQAMIIIEAA